MHNLKSLDDTCSLAYHSYPRKGKSRFIELYPRGRRKPGRIMTIITLIITRRTLTPRQQVTLPRSWRFWKRGDSPTTRRARCRAQSGRPTSSRLRCPQSSTNRCPCRAPLFISWLFPFVHGSRNIPLSIFTTNGDDWVRFNSADRSRYDREKGTWGTNIWHKPIEKPMKVRELWKGLLAVYFNGGEKERERYPINLPNGIRLGATYRVHGIFPWFVCSNFLRRILPSYNKVCNEIRVRFEFFSKSSSLSRCPPSCFRIWRVFWFWRLIRKLRCRLARRFFDQRSKVFFF